MRKDHGRGGLNTRNLCWLRHWLSITVYTVIYNYKPFVMFIALTVLGIATFSSPPFFPIQTCKKRSIALEFNDLKGEEFCARKNRSSTIVSRLTRNVQRNEFTKTARVNIIFLVYVFYKGIKITTKGSTPWSECTFQCTGSRVRFQGSSGRDFFIEGVSRVSLVHKPCHKLPKPPDRFGNRTLTQQPCSTSPPNVWTGLFPSFGRDSKTAGRL